MSKIAKETHLPGVTFVSNGSKITPSLDSATLLHYHRSVAAQSLVSSQCLSNLFVRKNACAHCAPVPVHISLLPGKRLQNGSRSTDILFIDHIPIVEKDFHFDHEDRILTWRKAFGGGTIHFSASSGNGIGSVGSTPYLVGISVYPVKIFNCQVAKDTGASVDEDGVLSFDQFSKKWKTAEWQKNRLELHCSASDGAEARPVYRIRAADINSEEKTPISFTTDVTEGKKDGFHLCKVQTEFVEGSQDRLIKFHFSSPVSFANVNSKNQNMKVPSSVVGSNFTAEMSRTGLSILGVFTSGCPKSPSSVVSFHGNCVNQDVCGYYLMEGATLPFSIFSGRMLINDEQPIGLEFQVTSNVLIWKGLSRKLAHRTKLGTDGQLEFFDGGDVAKSFPDQDSSARRLPALAAAAAIRSGQEFNDSLRTAISAYAFPSAWSETDLDVGSLLGMNPFLLDEKRNYYDIISKKCGEAFHTMVNSYIDPVVWGKLFPNTKQPVLVGPYKEISETDVIENSKLFKAKEWYENISTRVIAHALQKGDNEIVDMINSPRVERYLQQEVSSSPIYRKHCDMLFALEWSDRNPEFERYVNDEHENIMEKAAEMDLYYEQRLQDIQNTVADSDKEIIAVCIEELDEIVSKAKKERKYWAFKTFDYLTDPTTMSRLLQFLNPSDNDTTGLLRSLQRDVSVLSALDDSGWFANRYLEVYGVYLRTVVLLNQSDMSYNVGISPVGRYLNMFAERLSWDSGADMKSSAEALSKILSDRRFPDMIADLLRVLKLLADVIVISTREILALLELYVEMAHPWVKPILTRFHEIVATACVSLSTTTICSGFTCIKEMSTDELSEFYPSAVQFGMQIFKLTVVRDQALMEAFNGRLAHWYNSSAAVFKSFHVPSGKTGTAAALEAVSQIGQHMAKFLESRIANRVLRRRTNRGLYTVSEQKLSATKGVMGMKFTEFITSRLSPVFVFTGAGLAADRTVQGTNIQGIILDTVRVIDSAYMTNATVSGWSIEQDIMSSLVSVCNVGQTVAAICGFFLKLSDMYVTPPKAYEGFITDYIRPAGLDVKSKMGSVDFIDEYTSKSQTLSLCATKLELLGKQMKAAEGKSPTLTSSDNSPSFGFLITTDSNGNSFISAVAGSEGSGFSNELALAAMNADMVQFRPVDRADQAITETVQTMWKVETVEHPASLEDGTHLSSLTVKIESVKYPKRFLAVDLSGTVVLSRVGLNWKLVMVGMAPAGLSYDEVKLAANVPVPEGSFPRCARSSSVPTSFTGSGELPDGLLLDASSGSLSPGNGVPQKEATYEYKVEGNNVLGSSEVSLQIRVVDLDAKLP